MSVKIELDIHDGGVSAELDAADLSLGKIGNKVAGDIAGYLEIAIKNQIVHLGLIDKGDLYNSITTEDLGGGVYRVYTDNGHAVYIEEGTSSSPGRYVPDIERRLVAPTRRVKAWGKEDQEIEIPWNIGEHPGNRAYHFFEAGINDVLAYTTQEWLDEKARESGELE